MKPACRLALMAVLCLPLLLTGCSLFPTTRKLPVPKAPVITQTISPEELVEHLNKRWDAINTLTAKAEFLASVTKSKEGIATDYPSVDGHILLRKPDNLRVVGRLIGITVFDMASQGPCFTLSIPHEDKVVKGCGPAKVKSKNAWENLRPSDFFDAILVRGLESGDQYSVTSETSMVEDAAKKHLFSVPEYVLRITRDIPGSQKELAERVVYFHRDDLLPSQQDIYDADGTLETQVFYANYQDFESGTFPSTVTIKLLPEDIQIVLRVEDVHQNLALPDDQFVVDIPKGSKIEVAQ